MNNRMPTDSSTTASIGVVAICKNEEADLPQFLENVLSWADEIVMVDDASTDNSVKIIKAAGPKVRLVRHPMDPTSGFAGQRNIGIKHSSSDWLLHTDIDERVTPEFVIELKNIADDGRYNAGRYRRCNYFLHRKMKGGGLQNWNKPQFARRGAHHFVNTVHEECIVDGSPRTVHQLTNPILHLNDSSYSGRVEKSVLYCLDQAIRLENRRIAIKWWHLLLLPCGEFTRKFFLKKGFLDGVPGLIWSLHSASALFKAAAILWDRQNSKPRSLLEKEVRDKWQKWG